MTHPAKLPAPVARAHVVSETVARVPNERVDEVIDQAIRLLVDAGFEDPQAPDALGVPIEDELQPLLMLVLLRAPQLAEVLS